MIFSSPSDNPLLVFVMAQYKVNPIEDWLSYHTIARDLSIFFYMYDKVEEMGLASTFYSFQIGLLLL